MTLELSGRLSYSSRKTTNLIERMDNMISSVCKVNQQGVCRFIMTRQVLNLEKHFILIKPRNLIIFMITLNNTKLKKIRN